MGRPKVEYCINGHGPYSPRDKSGGCKQCSSERYQNWKGIHLQNRYGISQEKFDQMVTAQDRVCLICEQPETTIIKGVLPTLSVDHNHSTGQVRGLLCRRCNTMLGLAQDSPALLERAIAYLSEGN